MKSWFKVLAASIPVTVVLYSCSKDDKDLWDWMVPETEDTTTSAGIKGYVFKPALVPAMRKIYSNQKCLRVSK